MATAKLSLSEKEIRAAYIKYVEEKYGVTVESNSLHLHKSWDGSWEISATINYKLKERA